jgi:predicted GIY-YIG superfamily endonuclease/ribosomal protein L40E
MAEEYIYVLKLNHGKYYVGKTNNVIRRYEEHNSKSDSSAEWVKLHGVQKLIEVSASNKFAEDTKTLEYMEKFGVENVRGGSYVTVQLSKENLANINQLIRTSTNACFKCGKPGHFVKQCPENEDVKPQLKVNVGKNKKEVNVGKDKKEISTTKSTPPPQEIDNRTYGQMFVNAFTGWYPFSAETTPLKNTEQSEKQQVEQKMEKQVCSRCGRNTHKADSCYAKTHLNGATL